MARPIYLAARRVGTGEPGLRSAMAGGRGRAWVLTGEPFAVARERVDRAPVVAAARVV